MYNLQITLESFNIFTVFASKNTTCPSTNSSLLGSLPIALVHFDWLFQWIIFDIVFPQVTRQNEVIRLKQLLQFKNFGFILAFNIWKNVYLFHPFYSSKALSLCCDSLEQPIAFDLHISFHLIQIYVLLLEWWQHSWSQLAPLSLSKWFLPSYAVLNNDSLWAC